MPILVACFTPGPLLLGYAIHKILLSIRKRRQQNLKTADNSNLTVKIDLKEPSFEPEVQLLNEQTTEKCVDNEFAK